jgi:hypothetical protein
MRYTKKEKEDYKRKGSTPRAMHDFGLMALCAIKRSAEGGGPVLKQ